MVKSSPIAAVLAIRVRICQHVGVELAWTEIASVQSGLVSCGEISCRVCRGEVRDGDQVGAEQSNRQEGLIHCPTLEDEAVGSGIVVASKTVGNDSTV